MTQPTEDVLETRVAELLGVELLPGTDVMRDVGDVHFTHAQGSPEESILIPHPSDHPHHPLNWSKLWKVLAITSQAVYSFSTVMTTLSMSPMSPLLESEFHEGEQKIHLLTGVCVLTLGYSNFIIVPCSNIFGRRFVSLFFGVFVIATSIWVALSPSYGSLIAARALNGVATATNETLMIQTVADLFFLHERGFWAGIYFFAYFMGLFIGPIISGPMANRLGWRAFFWFATGLACFNLVLLAFFFPETKFYQYNTSFDSPETPESLDDSTIEKGEATEENLSNGTSLAPALIASTALVGKGNPSWSHFKLFQAPDSRWRQFLILDITTPLHVFFFPIILWAGLMVAGTANLLLLLNMTESGLLGKAPYNWTTTMVGFANFSFAVGGFIGLATAGSLSDWTAKRATKRNNGIREAEMRLPALIPYVLLEAIAIVIAGLGYDRHWDWEVILVIGYGITGLCVTSVPTIAVAYAIDSYKAVSGEIMVVATVFKNTLGFAMSYWVAPTMEEKGFFTVAMIQFALIMVPSLMSIPMYIWGKDLRRITKESKMHQMEKMI